MNERFEADVVVVGAGPSGIPAAIAAARAGSRVVLVEEDAVPGGAPVDNFVSFLCGGPRVGIFREIAGRLNMAHNLTGAPVPDFNAGFTGSEHFWYMPSAFLDVLYSMIAAEPNLRLICGAPVTGVRVGENGNRRRIEGVTIDRPGLGSLDIRAAITIDATGTGLIAALSGCETRYGRDARAEFGEPHAPITADSKAMPCTWMYITQQNSSGARVPALSELSTHGFIESNVGWCGHDEEGYRLRNTGVYLHWGSTVICADTRDRIALADAQREAFGKLRADMKVYSAHGFSLHPAPRIGVRESRRIVGETTVTEQDLVSSRVPEDAVAWAHYFLDLWGEDLIHKHVDIRAALPYRAMIPRGAEGLLVTGKAISGTHVALSAYRVQPIVAALGQAAGEAAAMAVGAKTGVRDIDINVLQSRLRQAGVL